MATLKYQKKNYATFFLGLLQTQAYRILQENVNGVLKKYGLTFPEWTVVGCLFVRESSSYKELSNCLNIELKTIKRIINELYDKGYIEITEEKEKNKQILYLTDIVQKEVDKIEKDITDNLYELLDGLSEEKIETYLEILKLIVGNYNDKNDMKVSFG